MGKEIKPIFIKENKIKTFKKKNNIFTERDISVLQIKELKEITYNKNPSYDLQWVYYPWSGVLLKTLDEKNLLKLRTNRNRNLITDSEQQKLIESNIAIVGLSVGSGLAVELQYQGISNAMTLAEFDTIETTNLNRIKASLLEVGSEKIDYVSRKIYEVNPYANLKHLREGLNMKNINNFLSDPKPRIIFEIVDDFEMKVRLRVNARELGIPVITFANLGDSIQMDIDRYDIDKNTPLFNGVIGDLPEEILDNPNVDDNVYAVKMVGKENVPDRAIESLAQIGKTLVGRPQLSSTVATSSALGAYIARKIILGDKKLSGRKIIKFNEFFE